MSVKSTSTILAGICALVIFHAGLAYAKHFPVKLKGYDGKELSIDSKEPYSPKQRLPFPAGKDGRFGEGCHIRPVQPQKALDTLCRDVRQMVTPCIRFQPVGCKDKQEFFGYRQIGLFLCPEVW